MGTDKNDERPGTAAIAAATLQRGEHDYGWFGGRANGLDDRRHVAFPILGVENDGDRLTFRFDWKGAVVSGRFWGRSFTGTWRQSTGDGEVALEFAPDFTSAEGWVDAAARTGAPPRLHPAPRAGLIRFRARIC